MQLCSAIEDAQTGAGGMLNLPGLQAAMGAVATDAGVPFANGVPGEKYDLQISRTLPNVHTAHAIPTDQARLRLLQTHAHSAGFFNSSRRSESSILNLRLRQ